MGAAIEKVGAMNRGIRIIARPIVAILTVTVFALPAGTASASRSIEIRGAGRGITASGKVTFNGTTLEPSTEISCDITLLRTVTSAVPKTAGTQFGKLIGVAINRGAATTSPRCSHGSSIVEILDIIPLIEEPTGPNREVLHPATHRELGGGVLLYDLSPSPAGLWQLIYDSFQGSLPTITGVNIHMRGEQIKIRYQVPLFGLIECLYAGNVFGLIEIVRETGVVTRARSVLETTRLERVLGSGLCPERGTFSTPEGLRVSPTLTIRLV
jgi:hypothetical protein